MPGQWRQQVQVFLPVGREGFLTMNGSTVIGLPAVHTPWHLNRGVSERRLRQVDCVMAIALDIQFEDIGGLQAFG